MTDERVVEFKPKAPPPSEEYPATVRARDYKRECNHRPATLDTQDRTVTCMKCDAKLDAFDVLLSIASKWDRQRWTIRQEKQLDKDIAEWLGAGGKVTIRPSGVVIEASGRRWASSCSGGMSDQLRSAISRALRDLKREQQPKLPGTDGR